MILIVERVSKNKMIPSNFSIVKLTKDEFVGLGLSFFSGYHRAGIKYSGVFNLFKTAKYTNENCQKVLNFVKR